MQKVAKQAKPLQQQRGPYYAETLLEEPSFSEMPAENGKPKKLRNGQIKRLRAMSQRSEAEAIRKGNILV